MDAPVFTISSRTVEAYDYVEITAAFRIEPDANPFIDVELIGSFGLFGHHPVQVEGFCDCPEGSVFKVRYMPSQSGDHNFSVVLRHRGREYIWTGGFEAVPSTRKGLLRVDPHHPTHFMWSGTGEHFFWNSTTAYFLMGWRDDHVIASAIDRLHGLRVNRMRVAINGRTPSGDRWLEPLVRPTRQFALHLDPWVAARPDCVEDPGIDVKRFNVCFWRRLEKALLHARERNMIFDIIFHVDGHQPGADPFGKEQMGGPDEQRYYRYVLARLSAFSNITWDVTNEWKYFRTVEWVDQMGELIKRHDPYQHLASCHGHDFFPFGQSRWCDFVMFQKWDKSGGYQFLSEARKKQIESGRPMPVVNEEYGYEDHYPEWTGEHWPARTADTRRRLAWEMTMAGCYQTTGERANGGTGAGNDTGGGWINGRGDESMTMLLGYRHMVDFFTSFPWWRMEPAPQRVVSGEALLLEDPGKRYVVYVPRGEETVVLDLAATRYILRWFNCRSGEWIRLGELALAGFTLPQAPDAGDWAMLIEAV